MPTVAQCAAVLDACEVHGPNVTWSGVAHDSRDVADGVMFAALPGQRTDGHGYLSHARSSGAVVALVCRSQITDNPTISHGMTLIAVDDVGDALIAIASWYRSTLSCPVIGVTGSAGKTTVRQLIAAALRSKGLVCASKRSYNNRLGVALTLLNTPEHAAALVCEVGISERGDMSELARAVRPDLAIVVNVGAAHLEGLGSIQTVRREKLRLAEQSKGLLPSHIAALLPQADPTLLALARELCIDGVQTFASDQAAFSHVDRETATVSVGGESAELPVVPSDAIEAGNWAAALAAAVLAGEALPQCARDIALADMEPRRFQRRFRDTGAIVIDDSYNSNPVSLRSALERFAKEQTPKVAIVGDMLELGPSSVEWHKQMGREAADLGIDAVLTVGSLAREMGQVFSRCGGTWLEVTVEQAARVATEQARECGAILVKGSRATGLDQVVDALVKRPS